MKTYKEANDTYRLDVIKADGQYHLDVHKANIRREKALDVASEKRKKTEVDPTTIP